MSRWTTFLWQALAALGAAAHPAADCSGHSPLATVECAEVAVDLADTMSIDAAFWSIVECAWGPVASGDTAPRQASGRADQEPALFPPGLVEPPVRPRPHDRTSLRTQAENA